MGSPVSRRIRTAVAPISRTAGGTPRRATGSSRSFAELLAEAEAVGGLIASRYARPAPTNGSFTHQPSMQPPGTIPGVWAGNKGVPAPSLTLQGRAAPGVEPLEAALQGMLAQGLIVRPQDREEKKSRPDDEPER